MPFISPKAAGDFVYPDYQRIVTIKTYGNVTKGRLYTTAAGRTGTALASNGGVVPFAANAGTSTNAAAPLVSTNYGDFTEGVLQAIASVAASVAAPVDAQYLVAGSRVLVAAAANLSVGDRVRWHNGNAQVDKNDPASGGAEDAFKSAAGRIFEIYEDAGSIGTRKQTTAAGDLVIVDLGMA